MPEQSPAPTEIGRLAARAVEILVTHNEPVDREDLACALGVSEQRAWAVAQKLHTLGYATLDQDTELVTATEAAANPTDPRAQDQQLATLTED
jgi:hypothetical protein